MSPLQYEKLRGRPPTRITQRYTWRDTVLYALAIGAGRPDPTAPAALRYTYEVGLQTLPMMAVVLARGPKWMTEPEWGIDFRRVVHGEQMLTIHRPLPVEGTVTATEWIDEIYDKGVGKGAVLYSRRQLHDEQGQLLADLMMSAFLRGNGGFGGPATGGPVPFPVPSDRKPDAVIDIPIVADQALLYRLTGDVNPLHIDPEFARVAGFDRPILHGLCTYGVAGCALIAQFCGDDAARLKRLDVRFSKPVFPGDLVSTQAWVVASSVVAFRCVVESRNAVVIDNGRFEFS